MSPLERRLKRECERLAAERDAARAALEQERRIGTLALAALRDSYERQLKRTLARLAEPGRN